MTAEKRKRRLQRLDRLFMPFPIYFVTACTYSRRHLLANHAAYWAFLDFAQEGPKHGAWIGRYVLMPDHLHAFVALDDRQISLERWMKSVRNTLSKGFRAQKIPAPHWQKTFFDHVLRSSESYAQKWKYVCDNPVRAGLVANAQDWPFQGEVFRLEF